MMRPAYPYREITDGLEFPEGPVVFPDGSVIVCEIKARCLTLVKPDGIKTRLMDINGAPNGAAVGPDGAIYVCNNGDGFAWGNPGGWIQPVGGNPKYSGGRVERIDLVEKSVTELYRDVDGHDLLMPNDLVLDKDGGIWFSDHGSRTADSFLHGGLFYGRSDGAFACRVAYPITTANGVGLSPDETIVYCADTETGRLYSYDIAGPGQIKPFNPLEPGQRVQSNLKGYNRFDSLAVEACGNIAVAGLTPGCITVISPSGEEVEKVCMPDPLTTNIAFGGADMKTAYITLSGSGKLIAMDWPRAGLKPNFSDRVSHFSLG